MEVRFVLLLGFCLGLAIAACFLTAALICRYRVGRHQRDSRKRAEKAVHDVEDQANVEAVALRADDLDSESPIFSSPSPSRSRPPAVPKLDLTLASMHQQIALACIEQQQLEQQQAQKQERPPDAPGPKCSAPTPLLMPPDVWATAGKFGQLPCSKESTVDTGGSGQDVLYHDDEDEKPEPPQVVDLDLMCANLGNFGKLCHSSGHVRGALLHLAARKAMGRSLSPQAAWLDWPVDVPSDLTLDVENPWRPDLSRAARCEVVPESGVPTPRKGDEVCLRTPKLQRRCRTVGLGLPNSGSDDQAVLMSSEESDGEAVGKYLEVEPNPLWLATAGDMPAEIQLVLDNPRRPGVDRAVLDEDAPQPPSLAGAEEPVWKRL